jgi:hypothetical protein
MKRITTYTMMLLTISLLVLAILAAHNLLLHRNKNLVQALVDARGPTTPEDVRIEVLANREEIIRLHNEVVSLKQERERIMKDLLHLNDLKDPR